MLFELRLSLSLSVSGNFRLRPKFWLSEITSPFCLTLYLDITSAQQSGSAKVKSTSEVRHRLPRVDWPTLLTMQQPHYFSELIHHHEAPRQLQSLDINILHKNATVLSFSMHAFAMPHQ